MPTVSRRQQKAMGAASRGKSRLGIPKSVGQKYMREDHKRNVRKRAGGLMPTRMNKIRV